MCMSLAAPLSGKVGATCDDDEECDVPNAGCQNGKCECQSGFAVEDTELSCSEYTRCPV